MTRLILGITTLLLSVPVTAQVPDFPNGCAKCAVYAYADNLELENVPVVTRDAGPWEINGWGFECVSGQPIDRIDIAYWVRMPGHPSGGGWQPARGTRTILYGDRPDVLMAYRAHCPALMSAHAGSGFSAFYDPSRIPLGVQDILFTFWRGPLKHSEVRRIRFQ